MPHPHIQRALPWLSASGSAAFLLVPGIPMWLKASFVFGLVSTVVLMRHRRLHGIDHAALVEQRRDRWQALLDDALAARGAGHVLHLRSGTGRDDAVEGMIDDALRRTGTPMLAIASARSMSDGPCPGPRIAWHQAVTRMLDRSRLVVLTPLPRAGLRWEISALVARGFLDRTIFRMPPADDADDAAGRWAEARRMLLQDGLHLPPYRPEGGWFRLCGSRGDAVDDGNDAYGGGLHALILQAHPEGLPRPRIVAPVPPTPELA